MKRPPREKLEEQLAWALKEFWMSGEFLGLRISHDVTEVLLKKLDRYLKWRWDRLYEPNRKKKHTKEALSKIRQRAFGRIR